MRKLKILFIALFILVVYSNLVYSQTAKINISIENFPWLLIEPYNYFKADKEIKVEKINQGNFVITFFGNKPKSYFINFREVLISPGDTININYIKLDQNAVNQKDLLIVSGNNTGNYIFSNLINKRMSEDSYPDYKQEKYLNNIELLCNTLKINFDKYHRNVADTLKKYKLNEEFSAYLLRTSNLKFLTALYYLNDNLKNYPNQRKELIKIIDSTFLNTNFVKSDTAYAYFMETEFNNYFTKIIIPKFNNIKMEKDYRDLITYIEQFPNNFIKEYFVYFLATDFRLTIAKSKSFELDELIRINPHIGKVRYEIMDKSNVYR